jgi:hypothetical protein
MKFKVLQDNLRKVLWERIEHGELTGLRLAQQTGFKQAHISNFLNRKRGLSLEGMDKVLSVQHLSVLDLLDPSEVSKRATIVPPSPDDFENIVVTDLSVAAIQPLIASMNVREMIKFRKSFLRRLRPETEGDRSGWQRFVFVRLETADAVPMSPRLQPAATLLIDRHYNALSPYRKGEFNMYAVLKNDTVVIRYVELAGNHIILRPHSESSPIEVISVEDGKRPSDYIVGRISYVGLET